MEPKRVAVLIVFSMLLLTGFLFYLFAFVKDISTGKTILNDEDQYGCLTHQGYTWNETEHACVLEWLSGPGRYQNNSDINFTHKNDTRINWTSIVNITEVKNDSQNLTSLNQTNFTISLRSNSSLWAIS